MKKLIVKTVLAIAVILRRIPRELRETPNWLIHRTEIHDGEERRRVPYCPNAPHRRARTNDPSTFGTFNQAVRAFQDTKADGIGFVLTPPFVGIDLDSCRDPQTGAIAEWAMEIVRKCNSLTEISPSGTGLHIFGIATALIEWHRKSNRPDVPRSSPGKKTEVAIYHSNQYLAMTGNVLEGYEKLRDIQAGLHFVVKKYFSAKTAKSKSASVKSPANPERSITPVHSAELAELLVACEETDDRSIEDFRVCRIAIAEGWPKEQVWEQVKGVGKFRERGRQYFDLTWENAAAQGESTPEKASQATLIVQRVLSSGAILFNAPNSDSAGYVQLPIGSHTETWPLASRAFKQLAAKLFWDEYHRVPSAQALADAVTMFSGQAVHSGVAHPIAVRVAGNESDIWIDLCDDDWRTVHITAQGWRVEPQSTIRFVRTKNMLPLPEPTRGGSLQCLRAYVNVGSEEDWLLLVACLVSALKPWGPYPLLSLNGEQGSAKTTVCHIVRSLIDPYKAPLRSEPNDNRDLMIAASNSWVLAFDNLSRLSPALSDSFCRLSTGGGFMARSLYSDDEEKLFEAERPVLINGIIDLIGRPDLLDRTITLTLPTIPDSKRAPKRELLSRFEMDRPRIFGALCDMIAFALRQLPHARQEVHDLPRMADFAIFSAAAMPAMNVAAKDFLSAYAANREMQNRDALESHPVAQAIVAMIRKRHQWEGTATELMRLPEVLAGQVAGRDDWPRQANYFAGVVRRLAPALRFVGIEVKFRREGKGRERTRMIEIRETEGAIVRTGRPVRVRVKRLKTS